MGAAEEDARVGLLLRLAREITARHNLDDVLTQVFRSLRTLVDFGGGSIQLLDDEGWIQMVASEPAAPAHVLAKRVPLGSSVAGRVILTERPVYLGDIGSGTDSAAGRPVSDGVRSYLGVPLVADGRAIGVLQLDSPVADAWDEQQRAVLVSVAPVVASAIQNARAHARADVARLQALAAEERLSDARGLLAAARVSVRKGDRAELERQLARIDALLSGAQEAPTTSTTLQLPDQRTRVPLDVLRP